MQGPRRSIGGVLQGAERLAIWRAPIGKGSPTRCTTRRTFSARNKSIITSLSADIHSAIARIVTPSWLSLPLRERGSKPSSRMRCCRRSEVAPPAGARVAPKPRGDMVTTGHCPRPDLPLAKPSVDHTPLGSFVLLRYEPVTMSTPDAVLSPEYDLLERRSKKRTTINHGAVLFICGPRRRLLLLCPQRHERRSGHSVERAQYRAFRVRHFVRQFPHDAPMSPNLAGRKFHRREV